MLWVAEGCADGGWPTAQCLTGRYFVDSLAPGPKPPGGSRKPPWEPLTFNFLCTESSNNTIYLTVLKGRSRSQYNSIGELGINLYACIWWQRGERRITIFCGTEKPSAGSVVTELPRFTSPVSKQIHNDRSTCWLLLLYLLKCALH